MKKSITLLTLAGFIFLVGCATQVPTPTSHVQIDISMEQCYE